MLSLVRSIWRTMSARGGDSIIASSTVASSGTTPAWATRRITRFRASRRSSKNAAANAAGSAAGVL